jgi:bile acid:Na+ symporter, BASS family
MFMVTPMIALMCAVPFDAVAFDALALDVPPSAEVAIVVLAHSPVPSTLTKREREAGGDLSFGIGLTATAAVLSVALTPALVAFVGGSQDRPYKESPLKLGLILLTELLVPLIAGVAFRAIFPRVAERIRERTMGSANELLTIASVALLLGVLPQVWDRIGVGLVAMYVAFTAAALGAGHIMGGRTGRTR